MNTPINGNDLKELGYPEGTLVGLALRINKKRNVYALQSCFRTSRKVY